MRLNTSQAAAILDQVIAAAGKVERGWRKAELLEHLAKRSARWREGPTAAPARARFQRRVIETVLAMSPGQARSAATQGVAPIAAADTLGPLLDHALSNLGFEAEDGKAVLRAAVSAGAVSSVLDRLNSCPNAALRARLLGALHHRLAKVDAGRASAALTHALASVDKLLDPAERLEILRMFIASTEDAASLYGIVEAGARIGHYEHARILAAAGGRADRLGDAGQAHEFLTTGLAIALLVPDEAKRASVDGNLREGLDRLTQGKRTRSGRDTGAGADLSRSPVRSAPASSGSATSARHVLALYDTYEGGLKEVHLRSIARAAPLCHAFGLDLALMGFPTSDLAQLVKEAAKETNIGDGGRYLDDLVRESRVLLVPCTTKEPPSDWSVLGLPVATTSEPHLSKVADFGSILAAARAAGARRLCLIMGLGKRGLPPSLLNAVPWHLELTGRNVSMETATAMGVIAERLRGVPPV